MEKEDYKENFIEKAKSKHGDKYDYSKVNFINTKTPVEIVCPIHGSFFQLPNNHISRDGCPKCNKERRISEAKEHFLKRAHEKYGDKYDYSKVDYINIRTRVKIICPRHGEFTITPEFLLNHSHGCPKCNWGYKYTLNDFLEKARHVHGDKYDYSKVNYTDSREKVEIICPEHGSFYQIAKVHLRGSGCPKCVQDYKLEREVRLFLKEKGIEFYEQYSWYWLKYKNPQRVDFYLPEYSAAIECQGGTALL